MTFKYETTISSQTPSNRQTYGITRLNSAIVYSTRNVVKYTCVELIRSNLTIFDILIL